MVGEQPGSLIQNTTWQNKYLIHEHNFWEFHDGKSTFFWEDSWKQLPHIQDCPTYLSLKDVLKVGHGWHVYQYWASHSSTSNWRSWDIKPYHLPLQDRLNYSTLKSELLNHRIKYSTKLDKLRWVHKLSGNFNLEEAYALVVGHAHTPMDNIWIKIWQSNLWPKLALFLWLTTHGKILTYDQLIRRGFEGSSLCIMCR
jgi:hypothetical protein